MATSSSSAFVGMNRRGTSRS